MSDTSLSERLIEVEQELGQIRSTLAENYFEPFRVNQSLTPDCFTVSIADLVLTISQNLTQTATSQRYKNMGYALMQSGLVMRTNEKTVADALSRLGGLIQNLRNTHMETHNKEDKK